MWIYLICKRWWGRRALRTEGAQFLNILLQNERYDPELTKSALVLLSPICIDIFTLWIRGWIDKSEHLLVVESVNLLRHQKIKPIHQASNTVNTILSGHSKRPKIGFKTDYRKKMQVKSIAECSKRAFCNTFDLHKATICLYDLGFVYFWMAT